MAIYLSGRPVWEGFQSTIDSSVLTDSENVNNIVGYLRGEALPAVQHLGRTVASYAEAKRQLDQLYNRKSALIVYRIFSQSKKSVWPH